MSGAVDAMSLEGERYSRVAMWLHWVIAALIVANLLLGFLREDVPKPTAASMMYYHKATGFAILALSLGRLAWRLTHRPPAFDPALARWEVTFARTAHWLFYVFMIVIPITGWLVVSSGSGKPTDFFGLFMIPALPVSRAEDAHELWEEMHELLAWGIIILIALHVLGAAKHHLQGHRHLIGRMGPWLYRGR
ncbi:MAG TPA: cytochrome b [Allosphingosinicella sp.]|jgi:cytochrome b561